MKSNIHIVFGKELAKSRQKRKMTQEQVAFMLGHKTKQHISNVERGDSFSLELGVRMAYIYKMNKEALKAILKRANKKHIEEMVDEIYQEKDTSAPA